MGNEKMRHTPGPWLIASDAQGPCMVMHPTLKGVAIANCDDAHVPANGYHSPTVAGPVPCPEAYSGETYRPERVANVRLIAASPELLEACKKALTCASLDSSVRALINAAVAKATQDAADVAR